MTIRGNSGDRIQVSVEGGFTPAWSPAGDRLHFRHNNAMMAATVASQGGLSAGTPEELFDGGWALAGGADFVVRQGRGQIVDAVSIRERPAAVEDHAVPGHW